MEMILEMWRDTLGITNVETKPWWNDWAQGDARADVIHMGGFGWGILPDPGTCRVAGCLYRQRHE